jgi:hypothetical protein
MTDPVGADLSGFLARASSRVGERWSRYTREDLLARLDGAVCRGFVSGVAVIEPVGGGTVWTPQRDVDAFIADGLLTEVTADGVTRLVRPSGVGG